MSETETLPSPKYPNVTVALIGQNGNAFFILGRVQRELKRAGLGPDEIRQCLAEATQGDYDHLLRTVMKWVTVV